MDVTVTTLIENAVFIAIFLLCMYGAASCYRHSKTLPGADLLLLGFVVYGIYGMLGWAAAGFNGSFMEDYSRTGMVDMASIRYVLAVVLRLGLIILLVGIFRVARGHKSAEADEA